MKKEIASLEVFAVVKEMQSLIDGRIDQIYDLDKKKFVFQIYKASGKQWFKITPQAAFMLKNKGQMPEKPEGFCLFLRKRLANARINAIEQKGRTIIIDLTTKDAKLRLMIELYGKGNTLLVQDNKIMGVAEQQLFEDRKSSAGEEYRLKERNCWDFTMEEFAKSLNDANISKSLAKIGLGGVYAREMCSRAGIKPSSPVTPENSKAIYETLHSLLNSKLEPQVVYDKEIIDATPWKLDCYANNVSKQAETYSEALEQIYPETVLSKNYKRIAQLTVSLEKQESSVSKQLKQAEEEQKKGEILYERYQEAKAMLTELQKMRKEIGMKGLKEKLKGMKKIKQVDEEKQLVVVDI